MIHASPTTAAELSCMLQQPVGSIVAASPNLSRVFQAFGIGFCCQGKLTLEEACVRNKVDCKQMLSALAAELDGDPNEEPNPADLSVTDLIDFITNNLHSYLYQELPRLHAMAERVAHVHGSHTPSLIEIYQLFSLLSEKLAQQSIDKERDFFPQLRKVSADDEATYAFGDSILFMNAQNGDLIASMARLSQLTHQYTAPENACNTYRALFAGLAELDLKIQQLVHLQNQFIFPAISTHCRPA